MKCERERGRGRASERTAEHLAEGVELGALLFRQRAIQYLQKVVCRSQQILFLTDTLRTLAEKKKCLSQKKLNANARTTVCARVLDSAAIRLPTAPPQPFRTVGDVQRTKDSVKGRVSQQFTLLLRLLIYLAELHFLPMSHWPGDHRVWSSPTLRPCSESDFWEN